MSSVAEKHLKENELEEDSKLINSVLTNKDNGAKRTQKEASQHLKKLRTSNIIQEIHDKEESDIDWQQEDNEAKNLDGSEKDNSEDMIEQQEKEVILTDQ